MQSCVCTWIENLDIRFQNKWSYVTKYFPSQNSPVALIEWEKNVCNAFHLQLTKIYCNSWLQINSTWLLKEQAACQQLWWETQGYMVAV